MQWQGCSEAEAFEHLDAGRHVESTVGYCDDWFGVVRHGTGLNYLRAEADGGDRPHQIVVRDRRYRAELPDPVPTRAPLSDVVPILAALRDVLVAAFPKEDK